MILNKEVISPKVMNNFVPLLDEVGEDFVARIHKKIKRSGQNKWTTDLSQELFKYALECKADLVSRTDQRGREGQRCFLPLSNTWSIPPISPVSLQL